MEQRGDFIKSLQCVRRLNLKKPSEQMTTARGKELEKKHKNIATLDHRTSYERKKAQH